MAFSVCALAEMTKPMKLRPLLLERPWRVYGTSLWCFIIKPADPACDTSVEGSKRNLFSERCFDLVFTEASLVAPGKSASKHCFENKFHSETSTLVLRAEWKYSRLVCRGYVPCGLYRVCSEGEVFSWPQPARPGRPSDACLSRK